MHVVEDGGGDADPAVVVEGSTLEAAPPAWQVTSSGGKQVRYRPPRPGPDADISPLH